VLRSLKLLPGVEQMKLKILSLLSLKVVVFIMVHLRPTDGFSSSSFADGTSTTTSSSSSAPTVSSSVSLNELLSTCVDACARGCHEIRKVQAHRNGNFMDTMQLKDANDPKSALTEADGKAQSAVIDALLREWGRGLEIIGEEEEVDAPVLSGSSSSKGTNEILGTGDVLRRDLCQNLQHGDVSVAMSDVTIYVDPLDGTREFVEQRLSNCQTLIGIAISGIPVAGVQGTPFPDGNAVTSDDADNDITLVYGHVGVGHGIIGPPVSPAFHLPTHRPLIGTGDSVHPVMKLGRTLSKAQNVLYGGAGNKILATSLGYIDGTMALKYGGPWDVCAPTAILKAMGGRITSLTGEDIHFSQPNQNSMMRKLGFIATGANSQIDHDQLVEDLRNSSELQNYVKHIC
jgi:3'-phosphoadenosine 5'-phosphosulfate (PAPS) 3'-phosphatase